MLTFFRLNAELLAIQMKEFLKAFALLAEQVRGAWGGSVVWKDAEPQRWQEIDPRLSQHRHPYCLAIKGDRHRRLRCCQADNTPPEGLAMEKRTCPFGVVEWVLPASRQGILIGWVFVGAWFKRSRESGVKTARPPVYRGETAKARADLVARLLPGILDLHPGAARLGDERLARARKFMQENLDIHLPASACARHVHLSTSRFIHWFAEVTGRSWSRELSSQVLARAADRLCRSHQTVTEIALDLGYGSPAGFTVAFSREFGMPPAQWRKTFAAAVE